MNLIPLHIATGQKLTIEKMLRFLTDKDIDLPKIPKNKTKLVLLSFFSRLKHHKQLKSKNWAAEAKQDLEDQAGEETQQKNHKVSHRMCCAARARWFALPVHAHTKHHA